MTKTDAAAIKPSFELARERVATQCICCGSRDLKSSPAVLMPFVAHRALNWVPIIIDESWGLSTINNGYAYSICRSLQCAECDLLFSDIRFTDAEMENLYKDYRGQQYNELRESYEPGYSQRNEKLNSGGDYLETVEDFLAPYLEHPLKILDWGGDTGKNTPYRRCSLQLDIYDISQKDLVAGARIVSKEQAFQGDYDLIVCSNVLEHLPYPSDVLHEIKCALSPRSILYIEVPFESLMREGGGDLVKRKRHWHEHINFYSDKSLRSLLSNVGLDVVKIKTAQVSAGGRPYSVFQIACRLNTSE